MRFNDFTQTIVDLSDRPSPSIVTKLKKGDLVLYEGNEYTVEVTPKKFQKGTWVIGIKNSGSQRYIKIMENIKPDMTAHEKKVMMRNIKKNVKTYVKDEGRMIEMIKSYHYNLSVHNGYSDKDVRECMELFPIDLIKKSGVVF